LQALKTELAAMVEMLIQMKKKKNSHLAWHTGIGFG
jgi:hypothetical protein